MDIIEKDLLQIEADLKYLDKNPEALTITQMVMLRDKEEEIKEKLLSMVRELLQLDE